MDIEPVEKEVDKNIRKWLDLWARIDLIHQ